MPEKVGKCKYETVWGEKICKRKALPNSKYCICHEQTNDKDIEEFNNEIENIMKLEFYNFEGFYFPKKFDFGAMYKHLRDRIFDKKVNFSNTIFKGVTNFGDATFQEADFTFAKFQLVDFARAVFKKEADFRSAEFERANFRDVTFIEGVKFGGATFKNWAAFEHSEFKKVYFKNATFEKRVNFENCTINEKIDFQHAEFQNEFLLINIHGDPIFDFRNTRFSDKTRIGGGTNLERALFSGSTAELVDFTDAKFPEKIYEERLLEKKFHGQLEKDEEEYCPENWQEVSTVYRKLKQAHQTHGDYTKAGEFFYREMECKRKSYREEQEWHWNRVWLWFYKILCGYGERVKNIVGCSAFIVFLCSFFYYLSGISRVGEEVIKFSFESGFSLRDFGYSIYYSIVTFTSLGYGDIHPLGWSHVIASIEVILGVFFMSLFVVVFVRKMSR